MKLNLVVSQESISKCRFFPLFLRRPSVSHNIPFPLPLPSSFRYGESAVVRRANTKNTKEVEGTVPPRLPNRHKFPRGGWTDCPPPYRPARFLGTPSLLPFFSENAYFFPGTMGEAVVFSPSLRAPSPSPMPKRWQRHCTILDPFIQLGWLFWQMALLHPPLFPPSAASKLACQKYSNFSSEASAAEGGIPKQMTAV